MEFSVNSEQLNTQAARLAQASGLTEDACVRLRRAALLIEGQTFGGARPEEALLERAVRLQRLTERLDRLAEMLRRVADAYETTDEQVRTSFSALPGASGDGAADTVRQIRWDGGRYAFAAFGEFPRIAPDFERIDWDGTPVPAGKPEEPVRAASEVEAVEQGGDARRTAGPQMPLASGGLYCRSVAAIRSAYATWNRTEDWLEQRVWEAIADETL